MAIHVPAEPFPPGEYIQDEIDARGWTHDDLASVLGMSRRQVINLIQGKSGITAETAHALADAFGQDQGAQTWMNLQIAFELAVAAKKERDVKRRAYLFNKVPIRELKRRGWLPDVGDTNELETAVCKFLGIPRIGDEPKVDVAARKGTAYDSDSAAQIAWFRRATQLAELAPAARFEESHFDDGIRNLLTLAANAEDARLVPKALSDMGVRLVLIKALQHTKIDGAAFWLDQMTPAVAISLRLDRIDNFWFTLMHELVHIKYRHKAPIDVDITARRSPNEVQPMEDIANAEAAQYLIPEEKLRSFIVRKSPLYYRASIVQFAQARKIHPGIVVGQLQWRDELKYSQLRDCLVAVRTHIHGQAITDGWGDSLDAGEEGGGND